MWIVIAIILTLLIIGFIKLFRQTRLLKKIKQHLLKVPRFNNGLIDCYVKVSGQIKSNNLYFSPISKTPCAFHLTKVLALWETKEKKPGTGMVQEEKVIFKQLSGLTQLELISNQSQEIIHIDMAQFGDQPASLLHERNRESSYSPAICQNAAQAKYKLYRVLERWYSQADSVVVYGKLIKTHDGLLYLKPTELDAYPSFICLQQHKAHLKKLDQKLSSNNKKLILYVMGILFCIVGLILSL
ncbi:MAG TPA: hypothetical protein EYP59_07310 [Thiotrichaceae bacterium]|nr:hypothetical protein [Thiotrichaceae bacterium]